MTCLLDTNIVSQRKAKRPHAQVICFLDALPREQAFLSVLTMMEIRTGIEKLKANSENRAHLEDWLTNYLPHEYSGRILPTTIAIADEAGRMLAAERKAARTPDLADLLIAATAKIYRFTVVTLNRKHFETLGVDFLDLNK